MKRIGDNDLYLFTVLIFLIFIIAMSIFDSKKIENIGQDIEYIKIQNNITWAKIDLIESQIEVNKLSDDIDQYKIIDACLK